MFKKCIFKNVSKWQQPSVCLPSKSDMIWLKVQSKREDFKKKKRALFCIFQLFNIVTIFKYYTILPYLQKAIKM